MSSLAHRFSVSAPELAPTNREYLMDLLPVAPSTYARHKRRGINPSESEELLWRWNSDGGRVTGLENDKRNIFSYFCFPLQVTFFNIIRHCRWNLPAIIWPHQRCSSARTAILQSPSLFWITHTSEARPTHVSSRRKMMQHILCTAPIYSALMGDGNAPSQLRKLLPY
jgi:hypothetical protein